MTSAKLAILLCLLSAVVSALKTGELLYVFAFTWTPEFCFNQSYPGCANTTSPYYNYWGTQMTTHGLWPQYLAGGYPADCSTEAFNSSVVTSLGYSNFIQYWPNVQYEESDPDYDEFWEHEWSKHGTCSGLSQTDYFTQALNTVKQYPTPSIISSNVGKYAASADIRAAFGGSQYAALQCVSGKYFSGVYMCMNNVNGAASGVTVCPSDVQAEDNCGTGDIFIQSF